ncbi:MAG TPA: dienelactone hydrolase family protein [Pyrinomonadaceae bacterium]|nr:dienelactone hydrolase family protein [Pyrinomonadaceae bacterium]
MKYLAPVLFTLLLLSSSSVAFSQEVEKNLITSGRRTRAYYLFVPKTVKAPAPLVVLLHGSGRNGAIMVDKWKDLAKKEGIILAGPDAADPQQWAIPVDGPDFLRDLVEELKSKYPINQRRIYLFGHSAGANYALQLSLVESEYFAATAIHAGALHPQSYSMTSFATRKTPIYIIVGTEDEFFPLKAVRATRDELNKQGFAVQLTEMAGHDHWYYDLAPKINKDAWEFLRKHELGADQKYEQYDFQ